MGELSLAAGEMADAQKFHKEAFEIREKLGAKAPVSSSRLALAEVAIEEGRAQDVEVSVRAAVEQFRSEKDLDDEMLARTVLVKSLLAQARFHDAQAEIELASGNPAGRIRLKALADQEQNKGYLLIARKAAIAASR